MTNEKRIEAVAAMLHDYDLHTGSRGAAGVLAHPENWVGRAQFPIYSAAAALLVEIRENMDRKSSGSASLSACKRILKACTRDNLRFVFHQDDHYCLCSGYHAVRLKNDLPSLPHYDPENKNHGRPIDLAASVKGVVDTANIEIQLPSVADLKTWIAAQKAAFGKDGSRTPYEIDCGSFRIGFNPSYLLDMIQTLPGARVYVSTPVSPAYFTADNGDGILCPVRLKSQDEKKAA